jgi:galactoside O-acetyltransferase
VGAYCLLSAGDGITLGDFSNLSQGIRIYSRSDDYSGEHLTNPTVPAEYTHVTRGRVHLHKHVIVGSGSVILPQVEIGEGSAVGALSLVKRSLDPWGIYAGAPVRRLKARSTKLLALEEDLIRQSA